MRIYTKNEWDPLRSIYVGTATNANWPSNDPVFAKEMADAPWKETPPPAGPVDQQIIDEANEDLEGLCAILEHHGVEVHRPDDLNFPKLGGMYNYCPRDRFLIYEDNVVDVNMMYPCRDMERHAYLELTQNAGKFHFMPRDQGMVLDAANICRMGNNWIMLESASGNKKAYDWLVKKFPNVNIELVNFYAGVHIDSTISPINSELVLVCKARVKPEDIPLTLRGRDIIWVEDVVPQDFIGYPYASKWIAMNTLTINPETVIMDAAQEELIKEVEMRGITVIPHTLRHSRTLGGGFHCTTLDLERDHES